MRRRSLRLRLLAVAVLAAVLGIVVADVVTWQSLRSSLEQRLDRQLQNVIDGPAVRALQAAGIAARQNAAGSGTANPNQPATDAAAGAGAGTDGAGAAGAAGTARPRPGTGGGTQGAAPPGAQPRPGAGPPPGPGGRPATGAPTGPTGNAAPLPNEAAPLPAPPIPPGLSLPPGPVRTAPPGSWAGLVRADGRVVQETFLGEERTGTDASSHRPQLTSALVTRALAGPVTVHTEQGGNTLRVRATRIPDSDQILMAGLSTRDNEQTTNRLLLVQFATFFGALVLVLVAGGLLVNRGLRPLTRMAHTAREIAGGEDLDRRIGALGTSDELDELASSIDQMLGRLNLSFEAQREVERELRRFVADASHELRTPLTSIRGYAELLRTRDAEMDAAGRTQAIARIEGEAGQLGRLLEDLLTLSQLDQSPEVRRERIDAGTVAGEAVDAARMRDPDRRYELATIGNGNGAGLAAVADRGRVRQVLDNLLGNARTHTPPGTTVTVRLAHAPGGGDLPGMVLEVEDNGPGLPADQQAQALGRFWRADAARVRDVVNGDGNQHGAGLGLSIVDAIARAHGGHVELGAPAAGQGLRVRVVLPPPA